MFNFQKKLIIFIVIFLANDCLFAMGTGEKKKNFIFHPNCYESQKNSIYNVFCTCITEEEKICEKNLKKMTIVDALMHLFSHASKKAIIRNGIIEGVFYECPISGCSVNIRNNVSQFFDHLIDEFKNWGALKKLSECARDNLIHTVVRKIDFLLVEEDLPALGDKSFAKDNHLLLDWEKE